MKKQQQNKLREMKRRINLDAVLIGLSTEIEGMVQGRLNLVAERAYLEGYADCLKYEQAQPGGCS